ncbi:MAG: hypothetical protein LDLANPLL_00778 [Turneriella sp.]|nr:hypothetical protein [Turneriella sp.]
MISHRLERATALFIGKDFEFAAPNFERQYIRLLEKFTTLKILAYAEQVHGAECVEVRLKAQNGVVCMGKADALFTRQKNTALLIRTADCMPILLVSEKDGVVGAVHAGWRGLEKKILTQTLASASVAAKNIHLAIGPFIGSASYEVGEEVAEKFSSTCSARKANGKYLLNLRTVLEKELNALGALPQQITWFGEDTFSNTQWYSARRGESGRNLAVVFQ